MQVRTVESRHGKVKQQEFGKTQGVVCIKIITS
jgi:hypothetical protein